MDILADYLCGGQWFVCRCCGRSGDMVELASKKWNLSIPSTIAKLNRQGIQTATSDKAVRIYVNHYIDYRKRLAGLWDRARGDLLHRSTTTVQLIHELGLHGDISPSRQEKGPRQLFGALEHLDVETTFQPNATQWQPGCNQSGCRVFKGAKWGAVLVFPFYDLPDRPSGYLFIGRKGDPEKDYVFKRVAWQGAHASPRFGFEAGLCYHPQVFDVAKTWENRVIAMNDPVAMARLQIRNFEGSLLPLPIVSWYSQHLGHYRTRTNYGWQLLRTVRPVFWMPEYDPETVEQAVVSGGRISLVGPEGPDKNLRRYASRYPPFELAKKIMRFSHPWPKALAQMMETLDDGVVEDLFIRLELDGLNLDRVIQKCRPKLQRRVKELVLQQSIRATVTIGRRKYQEYQDGWYMVSLRQTRTLSQPRLVFDGILRIEEITKHCRLGRTYYKGYVQHQGQRFPFCELENTVVKHTWRWLRELFVDHHCVLQGDPRASPRLVSIALQFHEPRVLSGEDLVGWDFERNKFVLPHYSIFPGGNIQENQSGLFPRDVPAWPLQPPQSLTPQEVEAMLPENSTGLVWAALAAFISNIIAPALQQSTCGIGLLGKGAEMIAQVLADAAGCQSFRFGGWRMRSKVFDHEQQHNWPILVLSTPATSKRAFSEWMDMGRHNCLVPLSWWMAKAKAVAGGWHIVEGETPLKPDRALMAAIRCFIPAYLQYLCRRNLCLEHWNSDRDVWIDSVLVDMCRFAKRFADVSHVPGEVSRHLLGDRSRGHAEPFADLLGKLIVSGKLMLVRDGFHDKRTPALIQCDEGIYVDRETIIHLLAQYDVSMPQTVRITGALANAKALVSHEQGGWLLDEAWWAARFRQQYVQQAGLLRVVH